ncbi:chemotaxis protein CheW [Paenibacillus thalictri]|uniref:Chemotaxis protein CheA n=1 Tax=Paenibacillus thalictri TaxID=2527873 RepID=A0A4Q9DK61_9BACL|nr:chemotaxis protein CheW [Paenibacillus thalictri]TBL75071.1 chemotaxis protein CheA [Paenibacillus thalictri]
MIEHMVSPYMNVFLDELEEQLQVLDEQLLALEREGSDPTIIQTMFRAAHTLKGSSAAMGFEQMKELTHSVESAFDLLRSGAMQLRPGVVDTLFRCVDYLKQQREHFFNGLYEELPVHQLMDELHLHCRSKLGAAELEPPGSTKSGPNWTEPVYQEEEAALIASYADQGGMVHNVQFSLHAETDMPAARALLIYEALKELGQVLACSPTPEELKMDLTCPDVFSCALSLDVGVEQETVRHKLAGYTELEHMNIRELTGDRRTPAIAGNIEAAALTSSEARKDEQARETAGSETKARGSQTVRVDVQRIEHLINLVGELIIDQTRLQEAGKQLRARFKGESEIALLEDITHHISRVIAELQEGMMKTRMLPIEQLFDRFPRLVRDLAQRSGKEIELIIEGKETELDRTLIEEISDPLIHMLRNAADHGLESPEEREKLGKPRKGQIVLKATHQEESIVITIADDGRGIDPQKSCRKAIEKGFITKEEAAKMTDKERLSLIFLSGVSTAEQISDISGRGVGMDIVRSRIEKLNGLIDIDTTVGGGTVFTIKLPLTLAIIRSLLVQLGDSTYALPMVNVIEIMRLKQEEIATVHGQEVCTVRGEIWPLVRLNRLLNTSQSADGGTARSGRLYAVMIGMAEKRLCLLVDRPLAIQEIVMKSLGDYGKKADFISGSTILGDGSVALILDVNSIVTRTGAVRHADRTAREAEKHDRHNEWKAVTFSIGSETYALDISSVKEIIPTPAVSKITAAGGSVPGWIQLRGDLLPVYELNRRMAAHDIAPPGAGYIMVIEGNNGDIGVRVDRVLEVRTISEEAVEAPPESVTRAAGGGIVSGICKLNGETVILLDIDHVKKEVCGEHGSGV